MADRAVSAVRTHDDGTVPVAGVYEIDGAHTSVEFIGRHAMITKVRGRRFSDGRGRITIPQVDGDLTVRDATRPVRLQVDLDGAGIFPFGDERVGFSAATEVNRQDFGLTWNAALGTGGLLVGKTARIELSVQAIAAAQPAAA